VSNYSGYTPEFDWLTSGSSCNVGKLPRCSKELLDETTGYKNLINNGSASQVRKLFKIMKDICCREMKIRFLSVEDG